MKTYTSTLVVLAVVTNPLVWAAACIGAALLVLYAIYLYCREECRLPHRHKEPAAIDLDECEQVPEPAPVVQVDEFGRVEVYTPEPLASNQKPCPAAVEGATVVSARVVCSQGPRSESVPPRKPTARPKARSKPKPRPTGRKSKKAVASGGGK